MSECARLRQQVWPSRLSLHSCSRENTSTQHVAASRRSDLLLNILCPRQLLRWAQDRQAWSVRTAAQAQQPHDATCAGCSVCKRQCLTPSERGWDGTLRTADTASPRCWDIYGRVRSLVGAALDPCLCRFEELYTLGGSLAQCLIESGCRSRLPRFRIR